MGTTKVASGFARGSSTMSGLDAAGRQALRQAQTNGMYEAARKAEQKNRRSGISSDQLTQDIFKGFAGEAASSFNREKSSPGGSTTDESAYMEQMLDDMCLVLPSTSCTTM